ncbi:Hypothetical predicted protein [Mytilus galloprovincialis]|uniref:Uncharacterized protein n=1 Tax=Mytilus galloprovincialis TaxID=29158 RepID=A0A8B6C5C0_MYTGA|nr:Hypothetical predicted protein [Mytilus galloprovincialis]
MDADIQQSVRAEVHNAMQNIQEQLLDNMTTLLESRLDCFQRRIQENLKSLSDTQIAKIDKNMCDTYKICKRGYTEKVEKIPRTLYKTIVNVKMDSIPVRKLEKGALMSSGSDKQFLLLDRPSYF